MAERFDTKSKQQQRTRIRVCRCPIFSHKQKKTYVLIIIISIYRKHLHKKIESEISQKLNERLGKLYEKILIFSKYFEEKNAGWYTC